MVKNKRTLCRLILVALLGAAVSACQIQPLHQTSVVNADTSPTTAVLRSIEISQPKNRIDQLVINELQFGLSGSHRPTGELPYTLNIKASKSIRSVGISDIDFGPAAFFITISVNYVLRDARKAAPIAQGTQMATAGYDRVDQEFANVRSEKDADKRAAQTVAQKLRHALVLAINKIEAQ